jgi:NAD(P)H dehydrogenase (quinone)
MARVLVVYYSHNGHTEQLAMAVAHGARSIPGAEVVVKRVPPIGRVDVPRPGSIASQVPLADPLELKDYDGLIFGTPAWLGNMCAEMRWFLDQTLPLWETGELTGKVSSVFVSTPTQHGGHETAITSFHNTLLHHGMLVVGIPPTETILMDMEDVRGGSPYGAGTITASDGLRQPSDAEFDLAEAQGRRVANIAVRIYG